MYAADTNGHAVSGVEQQNQMSGQGRATRGARPHGDEDVAIYSGSPGSQAVG
ncbi:unnamed protein product, partial [Strongylus vulgaris]